MALVRQAAKGKPNAEASRASAPPRDLVALFWSSAWAPAAILVLLTVAVYLPVHHHPFFTMDDEQYVVSNSHLGGSPGEIVAWAFTTYDLANWHPVTWLSHAADVYLFQREPAGHHDMNLVWHVVDALLLFWVLRRATGYPWRSFMVAALFALHPVNVETVAWVAEHKNVLSMAFFLLALGAYGWYAARPRVGRYLLVAGLFALGLMAKPQIITFPFLLLLWDYWPLRRMCADPGNKRARKMSWLVLEKLPLLALSAGGALMTMRAQSNAGAMRYYPLSERLGNAAVSYVRYLGNAFWPTRLAVFYPHRELSAWSVAGAVAILVAITGWVIYAHDRRYLPVGWFWFLGTLVPMIGVVQVGEQAMADRYAYLSFVGLFIMVCWGASELVEHRQRSSAWLVAPSLAVLVALCALTHRHLSYWDDNVKLWTRMVEVTGGSYEVEENLGVALLENGQNEPAMRHFERVTALVPAPPALISRELAGYAAVAHLYLGAYDQRQKRPAEAIAHYEQLLRLAQEFTEQNRYANVPPVLLKMKSVALANMGDAYYVLGDFSKAKQSYEAALQLGPLTAQQWMGLGIANQRSGNLPAAIEAYRRATHLQVSDAGFLLLAQALEKIGRTQEAEAARQQARMVSPDLAAAQRAVDNVLGK